MTTHQLALVIEDDPSLSEIFTQAVKKAGYEAEVIKDGKTAQARLIATQPAVVLLDLHLPEVSGAELLKQIRSDGRLSKTRVIIVTGDSHLADRLRPQADLVLIKPVGYLQLRDLARRLRTTGLLG